MKKSLRSRFVTRGLRYAGAAFSGSLLFAMMAFAQNGASPWENAVNVLQTAFTSTIARGLSLVAIVVAGLTFAFGEGGSKTHSRGRPLRRWHGHRRCELPVPGELTRWQVLDLCNLVTFSSPDRLDFSFLFLNVTDLKGIRAGRHFRSR
jgi:type IV secretory pathway VirB2 component (pilin)